MPHYLFVVLVAVSLLSASVTGSVASDKNLKYTFNSDKDVFSDWRLPAALTSKLNEDILLEPREDGVHLTTKCANVRMGMGSAEWEHCRIRLVANVLYPCSFAVLGHYGEKEDLAFYSLKINHIDKKLELSRCLKGKLSILQECPLPESFKFEKVDLVLEFDGQNIRGSLNGEKLLEQSDDGLLPKGKAGISGDYWTNLLLKTFEVNFGGDHDGDGEGVKQSNAIVPSAPTASEQVKPFVAQPEQKMVTLSMKNWDLSSALKKKAGCAIPTL
jgi:hypothetical protein